LLYVRRLAAGISPQATVILAGAVMTGSAACLTVICLLTGVRALPQASFAVQVSVMIPEQTPGLEEKVDRSDIPLIRQFPVNPFVKVSRVDAGMSPQSTVMSAGLVM
jgi:hypothetical protein